MSLVFPEIGQGHGGRGDRGFFSVLIKGVTSAGCFFHPINHFKHADSPSLQKSGGESYTCVNCVYEHRHRT